MGKGSKRLMKENKGVRKMTKQEKKEKTGRCIGV
jgi:hypothetical protein